jgi:hypothetical protein
VLIPVISHDRAGFGGGLCSIGSLLLFMARCAELNRSLVEIVVLMGCAGSAARLACTSRWAIWIFFIFYRPFSDS